MAGIVRDPTEAEKKDFIPIMGNQPKKSPEEKFINAISEAEQKALKEGKPFCYKAALEDYKEHFEKEVAKSKKKHGYILADEIKPFDVDLSRYSDLKNFDKEELDETYDEDLSKRQNLDIRFKTTKYNWKGTPYNVIVQESRESAIQRAIKFRDSIKK